MDNESRRVIEKWLNYNNKKSKDGNSNANYISFISSQKDKYSITMKYIKSKSYVNGIGEKANGEYYYGLHPSISSSIIKKDY